MKPCPPARPESPGARKPGAGESDSTAVDDPAVASARDPGLAVGRAFRRPAPGAAVCGALHGVNGRGGRAGHLQLRLETGRAAPGAGDPAGGDAGVSGHHAGLRPGRRCGRTSRRRRRPCGAKRLCAGLDAGLRGGRRPAAGRAGRHAAAVRLGAHGAGGPGAGGCLGRGGRVGPAAAGADRGGADRAGHAGAHALGGGRLRAGAWARCWLRRAGPAATACG